MASEPQAVNSQSTPNTNVQCWSGILDIDDYYVLYVHDSLKIEPRRSNWETLKRKF